MHFAPVAPTIHVPPSRIARDTYLIHQVQPALGERQFVSLDSMVILGREPVVVDTGTPANRARWLDDVFGLVDPEDVRWIFLSHDDVDHAGNLDDALAACPNAQLVCDWAMVERHTNCFDFPLERCRWVSHGESFDAGDRTLHALRPPVFDSPTTRGLFDPRTGVYWAADAFATPVPDPGAGIADLDAETWSHGLRLFALGAVSPWLTMLDPAKFDRSVGEIQRLGITTIASCHSPVIEKPFIEDAFGLLRELPHLDPPVLPDQSILDQIVAVTSLRPGR
jgi:flavorubredoxin